jgi:hypothetical protein
MLFHVRAALKRFHAALALLRRLLRGYLQLIKSGNSVTQLYVGKHIRSNVAVSTQFSVFTPCLSETEAEAAICEVPTVWRSKSMGQHFRSELLRFFNFVHRLVF